MKQKRQMLSDKMCSWILFIFLFIYLLYESHICGIPFIVPIAWFGGLLMLIKHDMKRLKEMSEDKDKMR